MEQLSTHKDHPGAELIYTEVRRRLPRISLGTVYRNLDVLAKKGVIQRLDVGDDHCHYDPNPEMHPHFFCTSCRSVTDLQWRNDLAPAWKDLISRDSLDAAEITFGNVLLAGICKNCMQERNAG